MNHRYYSAKSQRGAVLALFAIGLLAIIAMAGLALDMGHAYLNNTRLQNALDAAALNGAKSLNSGDATTTAQTLALATFNRQLDSELVDAGLVPTVEFSATLVPWSPGAAEPNANYVRVSVGNFQTDVWLARVLPGVGDTQTVGGSAVAGPAPLGSTTGEVCDIAPMLVCGTPGDTDCSDGSCYGYDIGTEDEIELKTNSQNAQAGDWEVGHGNFQLIQLDCGPGGACVREELAGGYSGCATVGDDVTTKPGNTVGPVAQGFNIRFGIEQGGITIDDYPPDVVTHSDPGSFWYDDYAGRLPFGPWDFTPVTQGGVGVPLRRVMAVPFGDCTGTTNGQGDVAVLGLGCFFMTQPTSHAGNEQTVYGQFVESCEASGSIPEDPGAGGGSTLFQIVLYKDPSADDA